MAGEGSTMTNAIKTHMLSRRFGKRVAVDQVDLAVSTGEIYGLLGPNGAGKTTLMRMLAGILKPTDGMIKVLGTNLPDRSVLSNIGYMTQSIALYEELTVRENVAFFGSMCTAVTSQRVNEAIELVDLADRAKSKVRDLSGGMQRRTSLACALVHRPTLLILDEPTVGVDPTLRVAFWDYFRAAAENGTTILVSSHVMDEAGRCDRLGFMHHGRLIAEGTTDELVCSADADTLEEAFVLLAEGDR